MTAGYVSLSKAVTAFSKNTGTTSEGDSDEEHGLGHAEPQLWLVFLLVSFLLGALAKDITGTLKASDSTARHWIPPYTILVMLIGLIIALGTYAEEDSSQWTESLDRWLGIDAHVILFVIVPALIFTDAFFIDFHVFRRVFAQALWLAGPGVIAGGALTGVFAFYVFKAQYDWSWTLAMAFGAIQSATDPVAVVSLLKELGAKPTLAMTVGGESLLNDGAAAVVFTLFLDIITQPEETMDAGEIVAFIFQKVGGGVAVGLAIGFGGFAWLSFQNRLPQVEVSIAITVIVAWASFFVGEESANASGLLATVFAGLVMAATARDTLTGEIKHSMHDFWEVVEYLANTLIFALSGLLIGAHMLGETADGVATSVPSGSDWFFLIVLYFYLLGIRLLIVMCSLPILNRLGPKMSYKDGLIAWWGGLRGALGLSLAIIADDASTFCEEGNFCDVLDNEDGNRILFLTGGIAFLTLLLNGSTTGWLLRRLGFTADDSARLRVLFEAKVKLQQETKTTYEQIRGPHPTDEKGGQSHDYDNDETTDESALFVPAEDEVIKEYIPLLTTEITYEELYAQAVKENGPVESLSHFHDGTDVQKGVVVDMRQRFLRHVRLEYEEMFSKGIITYLTFKNLEESIDEALDNLSEGLSDWQYLRGRINFRSEFLDVCFRKCVLLVSKVAWIFGWNAVLFGDLKGSFLGHAYLIAHLRARGTMAVMLVEEEALAGISTADTSEHPRTTDSRNGDTARTTTTTTTGTTTKLSTPTGMTDSAHDDLGNGTKEQAEGCTNTDMTSNDAGDLAPIPEIASDNAISIARSNFAAAESAHDEVLEPGGFEMWMRKSRKDWEQRENWESLVSHDTGSHHHSENDNSSTMGRSSSYTTLSTAGKAQATVPKSDSFVSLYSHAESSSSMEGVDEVAQKVEREFAQRMETLMMDNHGNYDEADVDESYHDSAKKYAANAGNEISAEFNLLSVEKKERMWAMLSEIRAHILKKNALENLTHEGVHELLKQAARQVAEESSSNCKHCIAYLLDAKERSPEAVQAMKNWRVARYLQWKQTQVLEEFQVQKLLDEKELKLLQQSVRPVTSLS
mmetsp:Transcript_5844/g.21328  ORF Transcript_5844/g.21328 Transcript_5844/m.21328 type:complete len:1082 (+) Transcript_5844:258-3503(+)